MHIVIYSPDRHILYDGATPDTKGVGGGLTARIRIAAGLVGRGHRVSVVCNTPRESVTDGVRYRPLDEVQRIDCDVLVMHSSGGAKDLTPLLAMPVQASVRIMVFSGLDMPKGAAELRANAFYACSNFIRSWLTTFPHVAREKIFVTHYGVNEWNSVGLLSPARDVRRLMYTSHPSKGLDVSRALLRLLRERDQRFTLHVYGGNPLWGGPEEARVTDTGIVDGGMIAQRQLAREYMRSGFALQLQTRQEPFGITVVEAMAAGCIVVASPVGAFTELIRNGETGFLIEGDPADPKTVERAAVLIRSVAENAALMRKVRQNAFRVPFDWATISEVWDSHINWLATGKGREAEWARCLDCGAASLLLADGYHCTSCGYFDRGCRPWGE